MSSTLASSKERDGIDSKYYIIYISKSLQNSTLLSTSLMIRLFVVDGRLTHRDAGDGYEPGYLGDDVILFKIQSTQGNRYKVKPVDGILSSKQKWIDIYIALRPVESVEQLIDDTKGRDKLLVRSIRLSQDEFQLYLNTSKNGNNGMENAKEIWKRYGERSEKTYIPIRFEVIERKNDPGIDLLASILPTNQNPNDMMNLLMKNWSKRTEDKLSSSELLQLKGLHDRCTPSQWEELQNISRERLNGNTTLSSTSIVQQPSGVEEGQPKPITTVSDQSQASSSTANDEEIEELLKMPRLLITKAESDIERGQSNVAITKLKKCLSTLDALEKPNIQAGKLELRAYSKLCDAIIMNDKNYSDALSALESALVLAIAFNDQDDVISILRKGRSIIQENSAAAQVDAANAFANSQSEKGRLTILDEKITKACEKFKLSKPIISNTTTSIKSDLTPKGFPLSPIYPVSDKEDDRIHRARNDASIQYADKSDTNIALLSSSLNKDDKKKETPKFGIPLFGMTAQSNESLNETKQSPLVKRPNSLQSQRRSKQFSQRDIPAKIAPPSGIDGYQLKTVLDGRVKYISIAPTFEEANVMIVGDIRKIIANEWGMEDENSFDMLILGIPLSNKWRGSDFGFRKTSFFEIKMKIGTLPPVEQFSDVNNDIQITENSRNSENHESIHEYAQLEFVDEGEQDQQSKRISLESKDQEVNQAHIQVVKNAEKDWKTKIIELESLVEQLKIEKDKEVEEMRNKYQELENQSSQRIAELEFELSSVKNGQNESSVHLTTIEELTTQLNEKNIELQRIITELETVKGENHHLTISLEVAKEKFREGLFPLDKDFNIDMIQSTGKEFHDIDEFANLHSVVVNQAFGNETYALEALALISPTWSIEKDSESAVEAVEILDGNIVRVAQNGDGDESDKLYLLDHVFQRQDEVVYEIAMKLDDTIKNICLGKQGLILICGSEKSGKSRIVHGQSGYIGLIEKLFGHVHEMTMSAAIIITKITVSLQLLDQQNATTDLILKQEISSPKDFEAILNDHHEKFTSSSSSSYHKVVTIIIEGQSVGEDGLRTVGVLRIVDLIDSEALQQHHQKVEDVESSTAIMSSESLPVSLTSLLNPSRDTINILIVMNPKDATGSILSLDLAKTISKYEFTEVE